MTSLNTLRGLTRGLRPAALLPVFALGALAAGVKPAHAQNSPGDSVFAGISVHTVNFIFPKNWDGTPGDTVAWDGTNGIHRLLSNNKESEVYIPARMEINCDAAVQSPPTSCIRMDSIGVRYKGNSTFGGAGRPKNPFRISFDEYGFDQRWNGIKGFTLNNANMDASHMAEKIHMDFAVERAGMAGPRMAYANVKVNGQPHSFYMMGELADSRLLNRYFGEKDGDLFKAIDGLSNNSDFTTTSFTNKRYENKSDSVERGWARLGAVVAAVNGSDPAREMPALINMNSVYRAFGTDILFSSMDSYIGVGQNYQLYFPEASGSRMEWILWDASLSFGKMTAFGGGGGGFPFPGGGGGGGTQGTACTNTATNPITCGLSSKPLAHKIMTTESLKQDYLRALWFLYKAYFEGEWLNRRIDTVATIIRPYLEADVKKLSNMSSFESNVTTLKTFVTNRQTSVASQFTTNGITAETAIRNGDVVINEIAAGQGWVEVYNTRDYSIDLAGHTLSDDAAQPGKWAFPLESFVPPRGHLVVRLQGGTIGAHGPASFTLPASGGHLRLSRASGSAVDSVTFGARAGDSTVARAHDGAAAFVSGFPTPGSANISAAEAPERVAPGRIRINEFMADNDSIKSPAGNNADWIELFNTSSQAISLTGMSLSDNPANPSKWQFPVGASIPANGYLVVWAYDTTVTGSLFARWALSKSGEHIRLSNADSSIVDSVTFGAQTSNRTAARIPNGTGAFSSECLPTLGAANTCVVTSVVAGASPDRGFALARGGAGRVEARFTLARAGHVRLSVHDGRGREVAVLADGRLNAGTHGKAFDLGALPGGLYVFRLQAEGVQHVRAGVLMK